MVGGAKAAAAVPQDNFHLLRHLLALAVLLSHSFALAGAAEPAASRFTLGAAAVHGFFAISGYLVTGSLLRAHSLLDFTWRRGLRVMPALVVACVASYFIGKAYGDFLGNPVPPSSPNPLIHNGSVWTILWECLLYGLLGAAGLLRLVRPAVVASTYVVAVILYCAALPPRSDFVAITAPFLLLFLGGAYLRLHEAKLDWPRLGPCALALIVALAVQPVRAFLARIAAAVPLLGSPALPFEDLAVALYLITLPVALIWLCRHAPFRLSLRQDYSYGIYVFAWPLQQAVVWHLMVPDALPNPWAVFLITLTPLLLLAALSWHGLEQPFLRLKALTANSTALARREAHQPPAGAAPFSVEARAPRGERRVGQAPSEAGE